jgi:hypothetical protein
VDYIWVMDVIYILMVHLNQDNKMKETEMHDGLPDREIRILIAHDLRTVTEMEAANMQKTARYDNEHLWDYVIEDCKNAIEYHQKRLENCRTQERIDGSS